MTYEDALWEIRDCGRAATHNAAHYDRVADADAAARHRRIAARYAEAEAELDRNESLSAADAEARMHDYDRALRDGQVPLGMKDGYLALMRRLRTISGYRGALWGDMPKTPPPYTRG